MKNTSMPDIATNVSSATSQKSGVLCGGARASQPAVLRAPCGTVPPGNAGGLDWLAPAP